MPPRRDQNGSLVMMGRNPGNNASGMYLVADSGAIIAALLENPSNYTSDKVEAVTTAAEILTNDDIAAIISKVAGDFS